MKCNTLDAIYSHVSVYQVKLCACSLLNQAQLCLLLFKSDITWRNLKLLIRQLNLVFIYLIVCLFITNTLYYTLLYEHAQ